MHGREKNNVEITAERAVLEPVVEHGHSPPETEGFPHPVQPAGGHDDGSRGAPAAVEAHLVLAVAPHDDRGPEAHALELSGEPSGDGRLPRPPHGEVADRDDREGGVGGGEDADTVEEVPGPDHTPVDHRERRREGAQENGSHAPFPAPEPHQKRTRPHRECRRPGSPRAPSGATPSTSSESVQRSASRSAPIRATSSSDASLGTTIGSP